MKSHITTLEGRIEKITYFNPDTHFTIARLRTDRPASIVTILGCIPAPGEGEALRVSGSWENHARYGQQLRIASVETILPSTMAGIRSYLSSGLIKGIGPKTAGRLVRHFKDQTLAIIERTPERLQEVRGIGRETAMGIHREWMSHHAFRALGQFLQQNGIEIKHAAAIFRAYGSDALAILRDDPYRLVGDIPGIGFQIADTILQNAGGDANDPERVRACLLHLLRENAENGHTLGPSDLLFTRCKRLFGIAPEALQQALVALEDCGDVVVEPAANDQNKSNIYLTSYHQAEVGIAGKLMAMLRLPEAPAARSRDWLVEQVLQKLALKPSGEQLNVLENIFRHRVVIITGGPGTGKTTLVRSITAIFSALARRILLAAPTGRAARRLTEITHQKAFTIHKLLGCDPSGAAFRFNRDNPLQTEAVIVDEASMIDTELMYHLLSALHITTRLILVGDVYQLPSVGPGNVLADLIASRSIPTFELKEIFRQPRQSAIVVNAHRVRAGKFPAAGTGADLDSGTEFCFIEQPRAEALIETMVALCRREIPAQFGLDGLTDIQVLTPMHKGTIGTWNLNQVLQAHLNPGPGMVAAAGQNFKPGDKVMHLRNNYAKDVFNGDSGTICEIDTEAQTLCVDYDGRYVAYDFTELDQITLAYAITVHKSQGSEYPVVILPILTQHYPLLQRNLLYTAITRGKQLVILIGSSKALEIALNNDRPQQRLSGLGARLHATP